MASGFDEAKVYRAIIDPMKGRFAPPRGVDHEVMLSDYVADLAGFDEDVLQTAFNEVRRAWEFKYWPPASTFRRECLSIASKAPASPDTDNESFRAKCRVQAVKKATEVTGSQKYIDAGYWRDGLFFFANREIEDRIFKDLLAGGDGDPKVTVKDMDAWRKRAEEARKWAAQNGKHGNVRAAV